MLSRLERKWEKAASLTHRIVDERRRKDDLWSQHFSAVLAWYNLELGRLQEAHDAAVEAIGVAEPDATRAFLNWLFGVLAECFARAGDLQRCEALCARGEALSRAANSPSGQAGALYGRALVSLERDDAHEAVRLLEQSLPLAKPLRVLYAQIIRTFA